MGPVWKILRRQRPPYPCTVQGRRPLLRPPLPACPPADRGGLAPTPADSAGPAPAPPSPPGGGPAAPPAPQFPPTPSPREQDMRRGPVYAGGGYRKRRGLVPPALLLLFLLAEAEPALLLRRVLWRCRRPFCPCAPPLELEGLLGLRAGAGFLWTVHGTCRRTRQGFSRPDGRRGASTRWTKVQAPPRRQGATAKPLRPSARRRRHGGTPPGAPPPPARTRPQKGSANQTVSLA